MLSQPLNSHPPVRAKGSNCLGPAERWHDFGEILSWLWSASVVTPRASNRLFIAGHSFTMTKWKKCLWSVRICTYDYLVSVMASLQATLGPICLGYKYRMMIQGSVSSSLQLRLAWDDIQRTPQWSIAVFILQTHFKDGTLEDLSMFDSPIRPKIGVIVQLHKFKRFESGASLEHANQRTLSKFLKAFWLCPQTGGIYRGCPIHHDFQEMRTSMCYKINGNMHILPSGKLT